MKYRSEESTAAVVNFNVSFLNTEVKKYYLFVIRNFYINEDYVIIFKCNIIHILINSNSYNVILLDMLNNNKVILKLGDILIDRGKEVKVPNNL